MKFSWQFFMFFFFTIFNTGIHSVCKSPQYIEIGSKVILDCFFPSRFHGIFWYDSSRTGDEILIRLEKQPGGKLQKSGEGYTNGFFDIVANGSLIIRNVSEDYDTVFKAVLVDENYTVTNHAVKAITTIYPQQLFPFVNGCASDNLCYISYSEGMSLNCSVYGVRPPVDLKWYKRYLDKDEELGATVVTHVNGRKGFSSTASVKLPNFISPITALKCQGFGIFVSSESIETDVILENVESYGEWIDSNVTERQVLLHSNVSIQCTNASVPDIFLWRVVQQNSTDVLMFSVFGNFRYLETPNLTWYYDKDSIILTNIQPWHSKGIYMCAYINGDGYSLTKVQLHVSDREMSKNSRRNTVMQIIVPFLFVMLFFIGFLILVTTYLKRKGYQSIQENPPQQPPEYFISDSAKRTFLDLCEEMADSLLNWPFRVQSGTVLFKKEVIEMFRRVGDDNEKNRKKKNIGFIAGSSAGILAGGLTITGLALAPITFGASLGLTTAGVAVGAGDAGTSIGVSLDKKLKDKKHRNQVAPDLTAFIELQKHLARIIVRLSIIYKMIDTANDLKLQDGEFSEEMNDNIVSCLREINHLQADIKEDVLTKVGHAQKYSDLLMKHLTEALKPCVQHDRWWEGMIMEEAEKCPFNVFKISFTDNLTEKAYDNDTKFSTFIHFMESIFVPHEDEHSENNERSTMTPDIAGGGRIAGGMLAAGGVALRAASIGDDAARIAGTVARFAQGVSFAGGVLSGIGIVVDIAFLGYAIYDLRRNDKQEFSKALHDVADMMENVNNAISHFTINPNEETESSCGAGIEYSKELPESPC